MLSLYLGLSLRQQSPVHTKNFVLIDSLALATLTQLACADYVHDASLAVWHDSSLFSISLGPVHTKNSIQTEGTDSNTFTRPILRIFLRIYSRHLVSDRVRACCAH